VTHVVKNQPIQEGGPPEEVLRTAIGELYRSCHVAKPAIVVVRTKKAYEQAIDAFSNTPLEMVVFTTLFMVFICGLAGSLCGLAAFLLTIPFHLGKEVREQVFWIAGGVSASFLYVWFLYACRSEYIPLRTRRRLLGGQAGEFTRERLKAESTLSDLSMIGSLTSAVVAFTGQAVPNSKQSSDNTGASLIRLGWRPVLPPSVNGTVKAIVDVVCPPNSWRIDDVSSMPRVLQAACRLADLADEALLLDTVAIVLPRGSLLADKSVPDAPSRQAAPAESGDVSPDAFTPIPEASLEALESGLQRRVRALLGPEGNRVGALVKATLGWPDLAERAAVHRAVGLDRVVDFLRLEPVAWDESGSLYRIGEGSAVTCYVRVMDMVVDGSGHPLEHWLAVPQHMTSAHEGVAWSFGIQEADYAPTAEA
jgi:hypothetical protein